MKAAVYRGPDDVVLGEWPRPTPGVGELLLAVRACGLCGSDILKIAGAGKAPAVFGHEVVGDVVDAGPDVDGFAPDANAAAARAEELSERRGADLADAHALIVAGAVVTEPLLTHRVPLGDVMRGVDLMRRREALEVLVTP